MEMMTRVPELPRNTARAEIRMFQQPQHGAVLGLDDRGSQGAGKRGGAGDQSAAGVALDALLVCGSPCLNRMPSLVRPTGFPIGPFPCRLSLVCLYWDEGSGSAEAYV